SFFASSIHAAMASAMLRAASSRVSPSDMQPGKSGAMATNPPPSSSVSGSITTGYSRFAIAGSNGFNEANQFANIDRLDRSAKRHGQDFALRRVGNLIVRS